MISTENLELSVSLPRVYRLAWDLMSVTATFHYVHYAPISNHTLLNPLQAPSDVAVLLAELEVRLAIL